MYVLIARCGVGEFYRSHLQRCDRVLPIDITFINQANPRCLTAPTRKLDLEIIDEFAFNGNFYHGLGFWTKD